MSSFGGCSAIRSKDRQRLQDTRSRRSGGSRDLFAAAITRKDRGWRRSYKVVVGVATISLSRRAHSASIARLSTYHFAMPTAEAQVLSKTWFYPFRLPSGQVTTTYDGGALDAIHATRLAMLQAALRDEF